MGRGEKAVELKHSGRNCAQAVLCAFTEKCGASICKELKGMDSGVVLCECDDCVRNAVSILEDHMASR